jgi:antitoxin (DNA-binding transcriptional repressor) of toxin-antitoxin stability system
MKATFVDLRTKSAEIIKAIDRNETVTVYYRGRPKATIQPIADPEGKKKKRLQDHPFFGMNADREDMKDVAAYVRKLRRGRYRDL